MTLTDEIRRFIYENYIKPAKERGENRITIVSGEVHARMGLVSRVPAVCSALRSRELQHMCNVRLLEEIREPGVKRDSSTNTFVFELANIEHAEGMTTQNTEGDLMLSKVEEEVSSKVFEDMCREELSRFFGVPLNKGQIQKVPKEFDMVSSDGRIIGDAKYFTMVRGERIPPAKFATIAEHVWFLEKTNATHKFLVFGKDRRVPKEWLKRYGHLLENVTFFFLDVQTQKLEKLN